MGKSTLLNTIDTKLGKNLDQQQCEQIAHSVLYHLWRRMPLHERERLSNALDPDLRALMMEPKTPKEPRMTEQQNEAEGPIEFDTIESFCNEVRRETGIAGDGKDQETVHAVFGALKSELPMYEVKYIHERLPPGLQQVWGSA